MVARMQQLQDKKTRLLAFSWVGGKASHLKWLLPLVDTTPHHTYVEAFAGSGAVLLNKRPSPIEVYNDLHSEVVNFFRTLRTQGQRLMEQLSLVPYSREEYVTALTEAADSDLERAVRFFVVARQVRSGLATVATPGRWGWEPKESRRGMALPVSRWLSSIDGLEGIVQRLKAVQIENLDGIDVIRRYDTDDTLHYLDPPYVMEARSGDVIYAHDMTVAQHENLLETVKSLKGKVLLSGYETDLYTRSLSDWTVYRAVPKPTPSTAHTGHRSLRQEVVWANFPLPEATQFVS